MQDRYTRNLKNTVERNDSILNKWKDKVSS